jgi:hypothetical protein
MHAKKIKLIKCLLDFANKWCYLLAQVAHYRSAHLTNTLDSITQRFDTANTKSFVVHDPESAT